MRLKTQIYVHKRKTLPQRSLFGGITGAYSKCPPNLMPQLSRTCRRKSPDASCPTPTLGIWPWRRHLLIFTSLFLSFHQGNMNGVDGQVGLGFPRLGQKER